MTGLDESIPEEFEEKDIKPLKPLEIEKASFGDECSAFFPANAVSSQNVKESIPKFIRMIFASREDAEKEVKKYFNNIRGERKIVVMCKKCSRRMNQKDECLCRPWLCFGCCNCETGCSLCNCSHKNSR